MMVIAGKLLIGILAFAATVFAVRSETLRSLPFRRFANWAWGTVLFTRLGIFVLLYFVFGFAVPSDVPAAYYPEAKAALAGKLVYRDFFSTYAPLFPYICAIPVKLWNSTKSIVLFAILMESVALPLWVRVFATQFSDRTVRIALTCYAFSPLLISTVAMAGQNHIWISPFLAGTIYLLQKRQDLWAGLLMGLCFVSTKFLALIFFPILFLLAGRRFRFVSGFAILSGVVFATFWLNGADILTPLKFQRSGGQESSGNLPYVLSFLGVPMTSSLYVLVAIALLGGVCVLLWIYRDRLSAYLLTGSGALFLFVLLLLLSKKAFTTYWACAFFPLCIFWSNRFGARLWPLLGFLGWGITAVVEPTLYFRWVNGHDLFYGLPPNKSAMFLACQVVLLGFNLVVLRYCVSDLRRVMSAGKPIPSPIADGVFT